MFPPKNDSTTIDRSCFIIRDTKLKADWKLIDFNKASYSAILKTLLKSYICGKGCSDH